MTIIGMKAGGRDFYVCLPGVEGPLGYRAPLDRFRHPLPQAHSGSTPRWLYSPRPAIITAAHDLFNHWNSHLYVDCDKGLGNDIELA